MKLGELAALRDLERWIRQNKGIKVEYQAADKLYALLKAVDKTRKPDPKKRTR